MPSNVVEVSTFSATVPRPLNTELADESSILQFVQPLSNRTRLHQNIFIGNAPFTALTGGPIICTELTASGEAVFGSNSTFALDAEFQANVNIVGDLTCDSLEVNDEAVLNDGLEVNGPAFFTGSLTIDGSITMPTGNISLGTGNIQLGGQLYVQGGGSLLVEGGSTFEAPIQMSGSAHVVRRHVTAPNADANFGVNTADQVWITAAMAAPRTYTLVNTFALEGSEIWFVTSNATHVATIDFGAFNQPLRLFGGEFWWVQFVYRGGSWQRGMMSDEL